MEHRNADPLAERARREQANLESRPESPAAPLDAATEERSAADLLADALNAPSAADSAVMVLLVDDQTIVAEAVRRALMAQPRLDFHYCANAEDALRVAQATRPTVILQDLVMPGVDGLTLVRQYRENEATRDIPIIVLSTKEEPRIKSAAFAAGANDYLVKLPDTIELIARIRYHSRSYLNLLQRDEAYRALRMSQQKLLETNLELQRLTNSDGLTGLSNRRCLDDYMNAEWKRAAREQSPLGFLMIDVDNFKSYNDTYGHGAGDNALQQVAAVLAADLRTEDAAYRYGGEEFVILYSDEEREGAVTATERLRQAVQALAIGHAGNRPPGVVSISAGVAAFDPDTDLNAKTILEHADQALYVAKQHGRNRVAAPAPPHVTTLPLP
jgi:two-component system chemotaxis family response regulator WspR